MELAVRDLTVARGGVPVLEHLSFTLRGGEALILRGPNGSGKTTLLRTLAGLQVPLAGEMTAPADSIAYGGHSDGLKPTLTVEENLVFWAHIYGHFAQEAAMAVYGLQSLRDRPAGSLSAGQKRRLGLARLVVSGRAFWLLDEPTVSLDAASVEMFASMIRAHLKNGGAALIATHIDLGLEAEVLDVTPFKADPNAASSQGSFDEAFL